MTSWYVISVSIMLLIYFEISRRSQNKKIARNITETKDEVRHQLELLNKMIGYEKPNGKIGIDGEIVNKMPTKDTDNTPSERNGRLNGLDNTLNFSTGKSLPKQTSNKEIYKS